MVIAPAINYVISSGSIVTYVFLLILVFSLIFCLIKR